MAFGGFGENKALFGQQQQQQPQPVFGASAFGAAGGGGGGGLFGAASSSAPATGAEGAFGPTGAFGQPASAPPAGTGLFGAQPTFGAPAAQHAPGSFAGTPAGAFGTPAPQPPQPVFGQPQPPPGSFAGTPAGAFGTPAAQPPQPVFGQQAAQGGFGQQAAAQGGFGQQPQAQTGFGQQQVQPVFGQQQVQPVFGQQAQAAQPTTAFGQASGFAALQPERHGTRGVEYQLSADFAGPTPSEGKFVAITFMQPFQTKSLEELRVEDYAVGDHGGPHPPAAPGAPGAGVFGAAAAPAAGFGAQPQQPQGTGLFGAAPAAPAPAGTGLFGAPPTFGAAAAAAQSGTGLFGTQPQSAPSLFGGAPAATGAAAAFGTPATTGTGLFGGGASAAPQTGLFGQSGGALFGSGAAAPAAPAGTGLFGAPPTFGAAAAAAASSGTGLFGAKPGGSIFGGGQSAGTGLMGASSGSGLFGSTAFGAKTGTGFGGGSAPSGTGLFGGGAAQTGGGLFGGSGGTGFGGGLGASSGTGLFGGGSMFGATSGSALGGAFGFGSGTGFGAQPAQPAPLPQISASVNDNPFGSSQLYSHAESELQKAGLDATGAKADGAAAQPTVVVGQIRPVPYSAPRTVGARAPGAAEAARRALGSDLFRTTPSANGATFLMGSAARPQARFVESGRPKKSLTPWRTPQQALRAATIKKLVIEPLPPASDKGSVDGRGSVSSAQPVQAQAGSARGSLRFAKGQAFMPKEEVQEAGAAEEAGAADEVSAGTELVDLRRDPAVPKPTPRYLVGQARGEDGKAQVYSKYSEYYRANLASPRSKRALERARRREQEEREAEESAPPFTKRLDISTRPPLAELAEMSPTELQSVKDFAVVRQGLGEVQWVGETDVTGLDIDRVVDLRFREIRVYPDEGQCPPVGEGLNKRAVVKLHSIWKKNRTSRMPMKDRRAAENMVAKLKTHCENNKLRFLGYDVTTGTWTFEAEHF